MCGIAGVFVKENTGCATGEVLLAMLEALGRRGPDSVGMAVREDVADGFRVVLGSARPGGVVPVSRMTGGFGAVPEMYGDGDGVAVLQWPDPLEPAVARQWVRDLNGRDPDTRVMASGSVLNVMKQLGRPLGWDEAGRIKAFRGRFGIGHTRMATESRVDLLHSQPLGASGFQDLVVVHNGHITNYVKLRRRFERQGYDFVTENDSEVIAVYVADRMQRGRDLEAALADCVEDLDGSFSLLVATAGQIGFARDKFALKPLVVAESDGMVLMASEIQAIHRALGDQVWDMAEPDAGEVRTWTVNG